MIKVKTQFSENKFKQNALKNEPDIAKPKLKAAAANAKLPANKTSVTPKKSLDKDSKPNNEKANIDIASKSPVIKKKVKVPDMSRLAQPKAKVIRPPEPAKPVFKAKPSPHKAIKKIEESDALPKESPPKVIKKEDKKSDQTNLKENNKTSI